MDETSGATITASLETIRQAVSPLGEERVWIAPSCSLLHVPFSLRYEQKLNPEIKSWLAFAEEKLIELAELRQAYEGETDRGQEPRAARSACQQHADSSPQVKARCGRSARPI